MKGGLTDYEHDILDNVAREGCHITVVFDPKGDHLSFAYSAGFANTIGQPEVIVFGLPHDLMGFMINQTFRECQAGLELADGVVIDGLLEGHPCIARAVHPRFVIPDYFNSALWFHRLKTGEVMTEAFQIVWPSADDGLFPWDPGCSDEVRELQPALYEARLDS